MSLVQLPQSTVKLITSTQIITSVASAVKELIENSLDAGAKNIDIKLENNGLDSIEVRDDGCGVKRCDALCMALPSYTSKIGDYSDLDKLESYGFRGEALNALCQVAAVTITTRTAEDDYAMTYTLDNSGSVLVSKPSSLGRGTVVTAKRLFYNLPVRKQYLSSNRRRISEELKRVETIVKSLAVIHPQLRVTFCHDRCLVWQKSACVNLRQSLMQVASHFITNELEELSMKESGCTIEMLIPKKTVRNIQALCQSSIESIMIYVNNRPIRYKKLEKLVLKYVSERFPEQLPLHRYPFCLISILTLPSELDVNLEPNKTQVMLKEEDEVLSKVETLLAMYYEITAENSQKSNETNVPESLNTSSSSETAQNERNDINADMGFERDEPTASKRMKLDTLENKRLSGVAQNTSVEITKFGKEVFLNIIGNNESSTECTEKIRSREVERPYDESLTTNASIAVNNGWTVVETDSVQNSDAARRNVNDGVSDLGSCQNYTIANSNLDYLGSSQNVNSRITDSEISGFDHNFANRISNVQDLECGRNISEISHTKKLGSNISKFFSSRTEKNDEVQQNTFNDREVDISDVCIAVQSNLEPNGTSVGTGDIREINAVGTVKNIPQSRTEINSSLFDVEKRSEVDFVDLDLESDFCSLIVPNKSSGNDENIINKHSVNKTNFNENKSKNEDLFEIADQAMEKWSMGMLKVQNGKILQGSTVLLPKLTVDSFNSSCQSVSSQMGQKEQSAFTKFSRDERPKILKEFPSIAFTKVAELLVERWRALPEEERKRYEQIAKEFDEKRKNKMLDVGMQKLDTFIKQLNGPKNKVEEKTRKDITKEESKLEPKGDLKVEKRPKRPKRHKQVFEISVQNLKQICLGSYMKPRGDTSSLALIGKLQTTGEWLYKKEKELGLVCHWGLQETVLYHRLMLDHTIPLKKLDSKILLEESLLGSDLWSVLLSLDKAYDVVENAVIITSDVISKNGFKIEVQEGRSSCLLIEVASTINFYGVNDLKDVLKLVKNHGCGSLEKCRNLRVMSYIRDEAVRIVRQCSAVMERDTLQDLINYWQLNLSHLGSVCLHRKPIFHVLKDLCKEDI